jgi:hypothetical protein
MSTENTPSTSNGASPKPVTAAQSSDDARPFPFTVPLDERSPIDAIGYSLRNARALADTLNTISTSDRVDEMRQDSLYSLSSMLMGYIEDAMAKLEQCVVMRKGSEGRA